MIMGWPILESSRSALAYSTSIGGTLPDVSRDVVVDTEGSAHIVGYTSSTDSLPDGIDAPAKIIVTRLTRVSMNCAGMERARRAACSCCVDRGMTGSHSLEGGKRNETWD